jgi:large subunit ribosomal protein L15
MSEAPNLSSLRPAQPRRDRKRVGRGMGSGKGRYAGRGIKGQKARSGSHTMRPGFEGGQMPLYMRVGKQRGATSKDAMPIGPHRTQTVPVNVRDLERVFADGDTVTLELLVERGLIKNTKVDVKVLGSGELTKRLSVTAHRFSAAARDKITAAGGTVTALREAPKRRPRRARETAETAASETTAAAKGAARQPDESVDAEPQGAALAAEGEG